MEEVGRVKMEEGKAQRKIQEIKLIFFSVEPL